MRGSAECIALATSGCRQLTDTVVYHLSQESLLCCLLDLTLDLIVGACFQQAVVSSGRCSRRNHLSQSAS